jgi:tricorn protease
MTESGYLRYPHIVGEQVVFTAEDDVWLASAAGGPAYRLTADQVPVAGPRLSPDGTTMAWLSRRRGEPDVFVMPVAGGPIRQVSYFGHTNTAVLGFAPDGRLLVCSAGSQPFRSHYWAYAIDLSDADPTPQRLPYGPANAVAYGPSGAVVVGSGALRDYAQWKRYRGGTAGRLWLDPDGSGTFSELLPELAGPKVCPCWQGDRLAFLADFEGHGNVYSVAADGSDLRRHTDHSRFYARSLAGDGNRLAYQHAGELWLLDELSPTSAAQRLEISLASPRSGRAAVPLNAADHIGALTVDRTARASAVEIRGNIIWLTHRNGPARVVAGAPGVRHRSPVILAGADSGDSTDPAGSEAGGDSVAYLSSAEGPDAIEIATPDGRTQRFGAGKVGRVLELVAAPDGSRLAAATHDARLLLISPDGAITELERNEFGDFSDLSFSPDSQWLAYAAEQKTAEMRSIRLVELASGTITAVTGHRFDDFQPAFSLDGKYLAFLSARTFDPVYDSHAFDLSFPLAIRPYLVTLAADTPSPFDPELAGQASRPPAGSEDAAAATPVRVDLEDIGERIVPFPVPAGRMEKLRAVKAGFLWTDAPVAGELGEARLPEGDIRPSVQLWDFAKRKCVQLAEHVDAVHVAADGSALVLRDRASLRVVPSDRKAEEGSDDVIKVDLDRIRLTVDPPAEWAQELDETGRLMAEHYWIADMAGIDWEAEVDKYRPFIDRIATRDDLSDVLWEINGETGSSHAYETPPPAKKDPLLQPAYLGADLSRTPDGAWIVDRVIRGDNSSRMARSPLTAPGVGVRAGDRIVAVNGRLVGPAGPAELLRGTAGKPVELRVERAGVQRSVAVIPLPGDTELRYLDWVAQRRSLVHEASGGRIGYVHIPDMVASGWAAFHRDLPVEVERDALLVDTRDNAGGHVSQLVIEKLSRPLIGWGTARHRHQESYPGGAPRGPLASLANEWAGSDGDIVNAAFQALELGPVIGTRTWGGVIGIDGRYKLVDGTAVTQPRFAFWFERYGWGVENHGVDPNQVVDFPPHAWGAGEDPQLAAGIAYLLAELERRPPRPMPDLATRPERRAPELPPRP